MASSATLTAFSQQRCRGDDNQRYILCSTYGRSRHSASRTYQWTLMQIGKGTAVTDDMISHDMIFLQHFLNLILLRLSSSFWYRLFSFFFWFSGFLAPMGGKRESSRWFRDLKPTRLATFRQQTSQSFVNNEKWTNSQPFQASCSNEEVTKIV